MGKEFQTFSVMVSSWNGVGWQRSKYRILEPAHPAAWILPHHAAGKEEVLGLAILEEVKEKLSLASPLFPLLSTIMEATH